VRLLDAQTAVIVTQAGFVVAWSGGRSGPLRKYLAAQTYVAVQRDGRWSVAAFQETRYHPWARTLTGRLVTALTRLRGGSRAE
jgi:hypothetical protein